MDPINEAVIVSDRKTWPQSWYKRIGQTFIVLTFVSGAIWAWYEYKENVVANNRLDEESLSDSTPYGILYYSGAPQTPQLDGGIGYPTVRSYDFATDQASEIVNVPAQSYAAELDGHQIFLGYNASTTDPDYMEPLWYLAEDGLLGPLPSVSGFNELDLVAARTGARYAYSYQTNKTNSIALKDWSIAVHDYDAATTFTIDEAAEPEFINEGRDLVYLKEDGVYLYQTESDTHYLIYDEYQNLSLLDDIAVSPDGSTIILTLPSLNLITILEAHEDMTLSERGRIETPGTKYRHPTISSDNRFYAVMAAKDENADPEAPGNYTKIDAEVRRISDPEPIDTISFAGLIPTSVKLSYWQ